jgi:hypothetical protein
MIEHSIRLSGAGFIYVVQRDGSLVTSETVPVANVPASGPELDMECEYYGGSQVMD